MSTAGRDAGKDEGATGAPGRSARPPLPAAPEPPIIAEPFGRARGYREPGHLEAIGPIARPEAQRQGVPDLFIPARLVARSAREVVHQVGERIRVALAKASTWWAGRKHHLSTNEALPDNPAQAVAVLRREEAALATREHEWEASAKRRQARAEQAAAALVVLERQAAAERERLAGLAAAAVREVAEREAAARAIAVAEGAASTARRRRDAVQVAVATAEQASAPGQARVSRSAKRAKKDATAAQATATVATARSRTDVITREATYPIVWVREVEIAGVRAQPVGMFDQAVPMAAPHSRVVGAMGRLGAQVDWSGSEALEVAAGILDAQRVPSKRGGQVKHVAHGVLSKPNNGTKAAQVWTSDTAMRAARHYLVGQGADPDRHDAVVFVHSQVAQRRDGTIKVEEAVHVLWSRVRDDGALFDIDHAFVAAAVSRARYDVAAGIDPERIGMASTKSKPVRDGLKALKKCELGARYVEAGSMRTLERVPLQGQDHAQRLAAEGHPEAGDIAGTWTPKPCYRGAAETRRILSHLMAGD